MRKKDTLKYVFVVLIALLFLFNNFSLTLVTGNEDALIKNVNDLFSERAQCVVGYKTNLNKFYSSDSKLIGFELDNRTQKFRDLEKRWGTKIINMQSTPYIETMEINGDVANVSVYEYTLFDWTWHGKNITSGFGVKHNMTWSLKNGNWVVIKDSYDEGPLTGVRSPDYVEDASEGKKDNSIKTDPLETSLSISTTSTVYYSYNRDGAASYADAHVNHAYNQTNTGWHVDYSYYNPYYRNLDKFGNGDCANYVSQAIHEGGGIPFINFGNSSSLSWWYDSKNNNNGTESSTSDDSWSYTWAVAPALYNFVISKGWGQVASDGYSLVKGDLVFYNWRNSTDNTPGSGPNNIDHVAIVAYVYIDYTSHTTLPLVDSHSNDYYHVPWYYGYSTTEHYPVHMSNSLGG